MKIKSLFFTLVLLALGGSLSAQVGQQGIASNPLGGDLTATSAGCATVQSCVWMRLPNNGSTATVTLAGTFVQTDLIELSGDGGNTWITNATLSAVGITSVSVSGFSDIRVRCSAFTSGRASVTINVGILQVQSVVSGSSSSSPSSLTTFFNRYYSLAPQDYGAKGDTHIFNDCGMAAGVPTITCGSSHFTAADVTKQYEMVCAGGTGNTVTGTISSFISGSSVGVSAACSSLTTNVQLAYGTDDTTSLQSWVTALTAVVTNGVPTLARGGYIPQGGYWTTKPLRFTWPGTTPSDTTGECGPLGAQNGQIPCSLWLTGQGTTSSFFYVPFTFNWALPSTATNNAPIFISKWAFTNISNFSVLYGSQRAIDTTANSGIVAGVLFDQNSHSYVQSLWVQGFHNTTNTLNGIAIAGVNGSILGDFESSYYNIASESNDINWAFNPLGTSNTTYEKILLDTIYLENPRDGGATGNMNIGSSTSFKQVRFRNIHFLGSAIVDINMRAITTDPLMLSEIRSTSTTAGAVGIFIQSGATNAIVECTECDLENTSGGATSTVVRLDATGGKFKMYGGKINCTACTNGVVNQGDMYFYGTDVVGPTIANIQTGAGFTHGFFPTTGATGGWTGQGVLQSTSYISNQGTACTNGELALSAGWQSTGSATVTAVAGGGQTCSWTITTGTTTAANPTVTDTLTNALPTATTVCNMTVNGGTHTAIVGAGTADAFRQTTLSATAPVFTYQETPTAGGTTYFVTRTCGP